MLAATNLAGDTVELSIRTNDVHNNLQTVTNVSEFSIYARTMVGTAYVEAAVAVTASAAGVLMVSFTPEVSGSYVVHSIFAGSHVTDSPQEIVVTHATAVSADHCVLRGVGVQGGKYRTDMQFEILLRDRFGNPMLTGALADIVVSVDSSGDTSDTSITEFFTYARVSNASTASLDGVDGIVAYTVTYGFQDEGTPTITLLIDGTARDLTVGIQSAFGDVVPANCVVEMPSSITAGVFAGFVVEARDNNGLMTPFDERPAIFSAVVTAMPRTESAADSSIAIETVLADGLSGVYGARFYAKYSGDYSFELSVNATVGGVSAVVVVGSFTTTVSPAGPEAATSSSDVAAFVAGIAGTPTAFAVALADEFGNEIAVVSPGVEVVIAVSRPVEMMHANGTVSTVWSDAADASAGCIFASPLFECYVTVLRSSGYSVAAALRSTVGDNATALPGSPYALTVDPSSMDASTTTVSGSAMSAAVAGDTSMFTVTAHDAYGNGLTTGGSASDIVLTVAGPTFVNTSSAVADNLDGSYNVSYVVTQASSRPPYELGLVVLGMQTVTVPEIVVVANLPDVSMSTFSNIINGLQTGSITTFTVTLFDAYGNAATDADSVAASVYKGSVSDPAPVLTADPACPCIGYPWGGNAGFVTPNSNPETLTVTLNNATGTGQNEWIYPTSYGMDSCSAHDASMHPYCADSGGTPLPNAPSWCRNPWCFIDQSNCGMANDPSSYFTGSDPPLSYSHETCGSANTFVGADGAPVLTATGAELAARQPQVTTKTTANVMTVQYGAILSGTYTIGVKFASSVDTDVPVTCTSASRTYNGGTCEVEWTLADPPQLEKAVITKSGIGIQLQFDTATDRAGMFDSERACTEVFDTATAAFFGEGSLCAWSSSKVLFAKFGNPSTRTVAPLATIAVAADTIARTGIESRNCTGSVRLLSPCSGTADCATELTDDCSCTLSLPVLQVRYPTIIGQCDHFEVDCSGSSDPAIGTATYRYAVDWNSPGAEAINEILAGITGSTFFVNTTLLEGDTTFTFFVTMTNSYSQVVAFEGSFTKMSAPAPKVIISGLATQDTDYKIDNRLIGDAELSTCPGASTSLNFAWTVIDGPSNVDLDSTLNAITKNTRKLYVETNTLIPPSLDFDGSYTYKLTGTDSADPTSYGLAQVVLAVQSSSVTAVIKGGDRVASALNDFVLDGSESIDPDEASTPVSERSDFLYAWSCATDTGESCYSNEETGYAAGDTIHGGVGAAGVSTTIAAGDATAPTLKLSTLIFTLTVIKSPGPRESTVTATVTMVSGQVPDVGIEVRATTYSLPEQTLYMIGSGAAKDGGVLSYNWLETDAGLDISLLTDLPRGFTGTFADGDTSAALVIGPDQLKGGQTYTFALEVTESLTTNGIVIESTGMAMQSVYVNDVPSSGETTVVPMQGFYMETKYSARFAGWKDNNVPLMYAVSIKDDLTGFETPITVPGSTNVVQFKLPTVGNITLTADVYDLYGSKATTMILVENKEAPYPDNSALGDLEAASGTGDFSAISQIASAKAGYTAPANETDDTGRRRAQDEDSCVVCDLTDALYTQLQQTVLSSSDIDQYLSTLADLAGSNATALPATSNATDVQIAAYTTIVTAARTAGMSTDTALKVIKVAQRLTVQAAQLYCSQGLESQSRSILLDNLNLPNIAHGVLLGTLADEAAKVISSSSLANAEAGVTKNIAVHGQRTTIVDGGSFSYDAADGISMLFLDIEKSLVASAKTFDFAHTSFGVDYFCSSARLVTNINQYSFFDTDSATPTMALSMPYPATVSMTVHRTVAANEFLRCQYWSANDNDWLVGTISTTSYNDSVVTCALAYVDPGQTVAALAQTWTVCDSNTQYQTAAPTVIADRVCALLTVCNTTTEYETVAPDATSDRQCALLTVCDSNAAVVTPAAPTSDRVCECATGYWGTGVTCNAWTTCSATQYQTVAPNGTADRECMDLTLCDYPTSQYESVVATETSDRVCSNLTVCSGEQFENRTATSSRDRHCKDLRLCDTTVAYQFRAATTRNDRECFALTVCTETEWESVAPQYAADRTCTPHTVCDYPATQWESLAPNATRDRVCNALEVCDSFLLPTGEYQTVASTETSNRVCANLTICSTNAQETTAATETTDRGCTCVGDYWGDGETCTPWTVCSDFNHRTTGQYETLAPTATIDRECANSLVCDYPATQYESVASLYNVDRTCTNMTVCDYPANEYESTDETYTSDRVCSSVTVCDYPDTEYESVASTTDSNRNCALLSVCDADSTETVNETYTADRQCVCNVGYFSPAGDGSNCNLWDECEANEWMEAAPTPTVDRLCTVLTVCDETAEYESGAGDILTDRVCTALTECSIAQYETVAKTATSDRTCAALTVCSNTGNTPTEWESQAPADTTDRVCTLLSECDVNAAETGAPATATDRVCACNSGYWGNGTDCAIWTVCAQTQYQSESPTATADRVCLDIQTCDSDATQTSAAVAGVSNTVCSCNTNFWGIGFECSAWTDCNTNAAQDFAPTSTANRGCGCNDGFWGDGYTCIPVGGPCDAGTWEAAAPTTTANRLCADFSVCDANAAETGSPTTSGSCTGAQTTDTDNDQSTDCAVIAAFVTSATEADCPSADTCVFAASVDRTCECNSGYFGNGTDCAAWKTCGANAAESVAGDTTTDRACECDAGFWAADNGADGDCATWAVCSDQDFKSVSRNGNISQNVLCVCNDGYFGNLTAGASCSTWQACGAEQWESQGPTDVTDRVCSDWTVCDPATQWIIQHGVAMRDTTCRDLLACNATTEYQVPAATAYADRTCVTLDICDYDLEFDVVAALVDRNRVCQNLTTCSANANEMTAATGTADRICECVGDYWGDGEICAPWSVCASFYLQTGEYETLAPNSTTNRECVDLRVCDYPNTEYESVEALYNSNRGCTALTTCNETTQYQSMAPTAYSDRACSALLVCDYPVSEYETVAATNVSNRECADLAVCGNGTQYESLASMPSSNRVCTDLAVCDYLATQFEEAAPNTTTNRVCADLAVCSASEYEAVAATYTSNRGCMPLTVCNETSYFESQAQTATADRVCSNLTVCDYPATQYQSVAATNVSNRECAALRVCFSFEDEFGDWESVAPTETSNRECAALTVCSTTGIVSANATATSDRGCTCAADFWGNGVTCAPWTVCDHFRNATGQYETRAPNATIDRECANLTVCSGAGREIVNSTATSDRTCGCEIPTWGNGITCAPWDECSSDQFETLAANTTANRECTAVSPCDWANQYEGVPATTTTDRQCAPLTVCNTTTQYESTARTSTSNRICSNLTVCDYPHTEYESVRATTISNRACADLTVCATAEAIDNGTATGVFAATATAVVNDTATSNRVCQCNVASLDDLQQLCPDELALCMASDECSAQANAMVGSTRRFLPTREEHWHLPAVRTCFIANSFYGNGAGCTPWRICNATQQMDRSVVPTHAVDLACKVLDPPVKIEATTVLTGVISTDQFIRAMENATGGEIEITAVKQTVSSAASIPGDVASWGVEPEEGAEESPVRTQFKAGVASTFNVSAEKVIITGVSSGRRLLSDTHRQLQGASVKIEYTVEADKDVSTITSQSTADFAATLAAAITNVIKAAAASCDAVNLGEASTCTGTATATCTGTAFDDTLTCDLNAATDGTADCPAGCDNATPSCDLLVATDDTATCPAGCVFAGSEASCATAGSAGSCSYTPASAVAASALTGPANGLAAGQTTMTTTVDASYSTGDTVRIANGGACGIEGTYTIAAIALDRSTVTFAEATTAVVGTIADCTLVGPPETCLSATAATFSVEALSQVSAEEPEVATEIVYSIVITAEDAAATPPEDLLAMVLEDPEILKAALNAVISADAATCDAVVLGLAGTQASCAGAGSCVYTPTSADPTALTSISTVPSCTGATTAVAIPPSVLTAPADGAGTGQTTFTTTVHAAHTAGDTVQIANAAGGSCGIEGTYVIGMIASDRTTVTFNGVGTISNVGTIADCSLEGTTTACNAIFAFAGSTAASSCPASCTYAGWRAVASTAVGTSYNVGDQVRIVNADGGACGIDDSYTIAAIPAASIFDFNVQVTGAVVTLADCSLEPLTVVEESCSSAGRVITELTAVAMVMNECQAWTTELEACLACLDTGLSKDTCVSWGINCDRYTQYETECVTPEPEPDTEGGLEGQLVDPNADPLAQGPLPAVEAPAGLIALAVISLTVAVCCCVGVLGVSWVRHRRTQKQRVYAGREPPPMPGKSQQLALAAPPPATPQARPVSESLGLARTPASRTGASGAMVPVPGTSDRYGDLALTPAQPWRRSSPASPPRKGGRVGMPPPVTYVAKPTSPLGAPVPVRQTVRAGQLPSLGQPPLPMGSGPAAGRAGRPKPGRQSEALLRITQQQAAQAEHRRQQQLALQDTLRRTGAPQANMRGRSGRSPGSPP